MEGGSQALNGRDASTGLATTSYVSMHESIVEGPRPESFVWWDSMSNDDVAAFEAALDTARREEDVQAYLTAHPLTPRSAARRWSRPLGNPQEAARIRTRQGLHDRR